MKIIAAIFIASELLHFIDYLVFTQFIHHSALLPQFQFPPLTIGHNITLGLVIWVLAIVFQRGEELQSENNLTV